MNLFSLICGDKDVSRPDWVVNSFPVIKIVIMAIIALLSIVMIVLVVMQKSDQNGISAVTGKSDTFYNRNRKTTLQGKIKVLTVIVATSIMVLCFVFMIISRIYQGTIA